MGANQLLINDTLVSSLRIAMRDLDFGLSNAPQLVKRIIRDEAWKERVVQKTGQVVGFRTFEQFVITAPLDGLGIDLPTIKRLCRDDMEAVDLLDQATQQAAHRPRSNDNIIGSPQPNGTSTEGTIRRLRKDRPDLHAQVVAGELSPHAAAIQAGFRKRTISIAVDAEAAAAALRRHFTPDQIRELIEALEPYT